MQENFTLRRLQDSDIEEYKALYKSVYSKDIDEEFFTWKNVENPAGDGKPLIYLIFNDEGRMIGANSFFPSKLIYKNKEYLFVQSGDTMVIEEYRGRGLFKRIITFAMKDLTEIGYSGIFGFANKNSYPGFMKLGFKHMDQLDTYNKILNYGQMFSSRGVKFPLARAGGKFIDFIGRSLFSNISGRYSIEKASSTDNAVSEYIESIYNGGIYKDSIYQKKDSSILDWKYNKKPYDHYETVVIKENSRIIGIFIVGIGERAESKSAKVLEYFIDDIHNYNKVIKLLLKYCRKEPISLVSFWGIGSSPINDILKKRLFIKRTQDIYFITIAFNDDVNFIYQLENWHIVNGDSDTA